MVYNHLSCISLLLIINMLVRGFRIGSIALHSSRFLPASAIVRALSSSMQSKELSVYSENSLVEKVYGPVSKTLVSVPQFAKGQLTDMKILNLSSMGATVALGNTNKKGIILANELDVYHEGKAFSQYLRIGDSVDGFVANIDENGRILMSLRPSVEKRITSTRDLIMNALQLSPTGELPIGDKSTPEEIAQFFHGVSKTDFKNAVGALFKERRIKPGPHALALRSEEELETDRRQAKPYVEKPHFLRTDPSLCIFIGNLPLSVGESTLTSEVEGVVGLDCVDEVRLVRNPVTKESRGFAYVQFKTRNSAIFALRSLRDSHMFGRRIRVSRASKKVDIVKVPSSTPHSAPLSELLTSTAVVRHSSDVGGDEVSEGDDKVVTEALKLQNRKEKKDKNVSGASPAAVREEQHESEEEGDVDGVLSPEEYEHYASLIEGDDDFDPERDFYIVEKDNEVVRGGGDRVTKIRSSESEGDNERYPEEGEEQEEEEEEPEPEDYNDFSLYQSKGEATSVDATTGSARGSGERETRRRGGGDSERRRTREPTDSSDRRGSSSGRSDGRGGGAGGGAVRRRRDGEMDRERREEGRQRTRTDRQY